MLEELRANRTAMTVKNITEFKSPRTIANDFVLRREHESDSFVPLRHFQKSGRDSMPC